MLKEDRDAYLAFWENFGKVLKEGIFSDGKNRARILEVSLFDTTGPEGPVTLDEYLARMPEGQEEIYYITAPSLTVGKNAPHLEAFTEKGYEVIVLSDPVDEIWSPAVEDYKGKKFTSLSRGAVEVPSSAEAGEDVASGEGLEALLEDLGKALSGEVKEVRVSERLKASPSCLVGEAFDLTPQMEAFLRAAGQEVPRVKRNLEINPSHPLVMKLKGIHDADPSDPRVARFARVLFGLATLSEGGGLDDPAAFSREVAELLSEPV